MCPRWYGGKDAVAFCRSGGGCHGVAVAVEHHVADGCCEAAEHGWVFLCRVECLDCREGWSRDGWEGGAYGVVKVCFACVGEPRSLTCDVSVYWEEDREGRAEDFVHVA